MQTISIIKPSEMGADFLFKDGVWQVRYPEVQETRPSVSVDGNNALTTGADEGAHLSAALLQNHIMVQDNANQKIHLYRFQAGTEFSVESATLVSSIDMVELNGEFDDVAIDGRTITFTDVQTDRKLTLDLDALQKVGAVKGAPSVEVVNDNGVLTLSTIVKEAEGNLLEESEDGLKVDTYQTHNYLLDEGITKQTFESKEDAIHHTIGNKKLIIPTLVIANSSNTILGKAINHSANNFIPSPGIKVATNQASLLTVLVNGALTGEPTPGVVENSDVEYLTTSDNLIKIKISSSDYEARNLHFVFLEILTSKEDYNKLNSESIIKITESHNGGGESVNTITGFQFKQDLIEYQGKYYTLIYQDFVSEGEQTTNLSFDIDLDGKGKEYVPTVSNITIKTEWVKLISSSVDDFIEKGFEVDITNRGWTAFNTDNDSNEVADEFAEENVTPEVIKAVRLGLNMGRIGLRAFKDQQITRLVTPPSIYTIQAKAFENNSISELTLNEGLESIGYNAFYGSPIEVVQLPDSVTRVESEAFHSSALKEVYLGSNIKYIHAQSFSVPDNNTPLTITITTPVPPPVANFSQFSANTTIRVPNEYLTAYKGVSPWMMANLVGF